MTTPWFTPQNPNQGPTLPAPRNDSWFNPSANPQDDGVFTYLGNLGSYVTNALFPAPNLESDINTLKHPLQDLQKKGQYAENVIGQIGSNIAKTASDIWDNPSQSMASTLQGIKQGLSNFRQNPVTTLIKSVGTNFIESPIKALTATTNQQGIAIPATPEEQAQNVQEFAGNIAAGVAYEGVSKLIATPVAGMSDAAAVAANASSRMGRLGKTILKEMGATGIASGTQAAIANLGQDDYTAKLAASFLSMPAFEIAAGFGLMKNRATNLALSGRMSQIAGEQYSLAQDQALARTLQITDNTTPKEALDRVDALSSANDQLDLAIKAKKPFVFPQATPDQIKYIQDNVKANVVVGPNNDVLVSHSIMTPDTKAFYAKSGFLPNETVSINGMDGNILDINAAGKAFVKMTGDGSNVVADLKDVLRKPQSIATFEQIVPRGVSSTTIPGKATTIEAEPYQMANQFSKSAPRYGYGSKLFGLNFTSDLDKAAYILQGDTKSAAHDAILEDVMRQTGMSKSDIIAHGQKVKSAIKDLAKNSSEEDLTVPSMSPKVQKTVISPPTKVETPLEARTIKTTIEPTVVSKQATLDNLYAKFRRIFNPDELQTDSFDNKVARFFQLNKIPDSQSGNVLSYFYSKLDQEFMKSLPLEELGHIRDSQDIIKRNLQTQLVKQGTLVADRALERGTYLINDGGSRYSLYDGNSGSRIKSFVNYDEIAKFLDALPQDNGKALDGGGTGQISTGIGNSGQYRYTPPTNKVQDWLASMRSGSMGMYISPIAQRITGISNLTQSGEAGAKVADQIVRASQVKHSFIINHLQEVVNNIQQATKLKGVDFDRVGDYMSTSSLEERLRWSNPAEQNAATQLAGMGADLNDVREYIYAKRVSNDPTILKNVDPKVKKAGDFFESLIGVEGVHPRNVIGVADAMMNPLENLSQAQWEIQNRLTPAEKAAHNLLRTSFDRMAQIAGIPQDQFIKQYLPIMRKYGSIFDTKWTSAELPDKFAHELTRLDITPQSMRNVNALEVAYKYMMSLASVKSGAYDLLSNARKDAASWVDGVNSMAATEKDPVTQLKLLQNGKTILPNVDQWIDNVRGLPNLKEGDPTLLAKSFGDTFKIKVTPNSLMYLVSTAKLGFKPAMLMMDIMSAHTLGYTLFGAKVLKDALYMPVSDSYISSLVRRGELPPLTGENLISLNPQYVGSDLLSKMNEVGLIASGQEYAYRKISAGFYKAIFNKVTDVTNDYMAKKITAKDIANELGDVLTVHDASKQTFAMNLISNNKFEDAARYLAREGSAKIANRFGDMYNPLGWQRSTFGKLLGQFNSWGANATSSMFDALSNGTPKQIAIRAMRATAANTLAFAAVSAAGFDASRYLTIPFTTFPAGGPLLQTGWDVVRNTQNAMSNDDQRRQYAIQHLKQDFSGLFSPTLMYDVQQAGKIWQQNATQLQVAGQLMGMKAVIPK